MSGVNESEPYVGRRERLMERFADGVILVRGAGHPKPNPNFFYLTGMNEPRAALLLARAGMRIGTGRANPGPDYQRGRRVRQVLFLPPSDPMAARWGEQSSATVGSVSAERVGVDAVLDASELEPVLGQALAGAANFYFVRSAPASLVTSDPVDAPFVARIRDRFFHVELRDATPEVHEMRRLKDAGEIAGIERSVAVVAEALERVMTSIRAGQMEHELEAEIVRVYRKHGGTHAFDPIIGCGPNALQLHYTANSGPIEAGRLTLIDTGASIDGYQADITRTIPVDGRFTERQREIYETVLAAQQAVIDRCKPGALVGELHAEAFEKIADAGYGQYFVHGTSHHLGLETHDVGDPERPLASGAVITVEPGIYIPEEEIGIRIEDDVLITADGHRVLSEAIPKSITAIEQRMTAPR